MANASTPGIADAGGSSDANTGGQEPHEHLLSHDGHGHAQRARHEAEHEELHEEEHERLREPGTEASQHRRGIEMPAQVARRGQRDRHRREQHGHECGEAHEFLRALERLADFGTQVAHVLYPLPGLHLAVEPRAEARERIATAAIGHEETIGRAIAGLQEIGGGNVRRC